MTARMTTNRGRLVDRVDRVEAGGRNDSDEARFTGCAVRKATHACSGGSPARGIQREMRSDKAPRVARTRAPGGWYIS